VTPLVSLLFAWPLLAEAPGDERALTVFQRLEPALQWRVLLALLGFGVLFIGGALLIWLGARYARTYMADDDSPGPPRDDDWTRKPLS
jgi:hypothetical protein